MKTSELLKTLRGKDFKNEPENQRNSPISVLEFESDNEFSFSPIKEKKLQTGLAEILAPKSRSKSKPKKIQEKNKKKTPDFNKKNKYVEIEPTFKPEINPKSAKLVKHAEKEGRNLHSKRPEKISPQPNPIEFKPQKKNISLEEFLNRNYTLQLSKAEERKANRAVSPLDRLDGECTFKPKLDHKSKEMAQTHRVGLYELALRRLEERKNNIEEANKKKEIEDLKNCTFTPRILKKVNMQSKVNSRNTPDILTYSSKFNRNISPMSIVDYMDDSNE